MPKHITADEFNASLYKSFEKFLNHQKVLYSMNTLLNGFSDFPQGFSFNQTANELYIARQLNDGTEVKISRYSLPALTLVDTKSFTKSTGAYQEGLPYFYNASNKLCFLVRTTYSDNLAVFNYTDGTLGSNMTVIGGSKVSMDVDKKYLITSFGSADRTEGANVYDFNSVVAGSPVLIKTVYFPNSVADGEKTQGMTIIDDKIVLGRGKTFPCLTVLNMDGTLLGSVDLSKSEIGVMTSSFDGQVVNTGNYVYENEGVSFYSYNGSIIPIVCHIVGSKCYFTLVGSFEFTKINTSLISDSVSNAINWKRPTFIGDVTDYNSSIIVRYGKNSDGQVTIEGVCAHPYTNQTPNRVLFNIPFPYRPRQNVFRSTQASGGADKLNRIEIKTSGDVVLVATTSTVDPAFTTLDGIIFST
jgi:hypothetical protein